jgi:hypothetical protein
MNYWNSPRKIAAWQNEFNEKESRGVLRCQTPAEYARQAISSSDYAPRHAKELPENMRIPYHPPATMGGVPL